MKKYLIVLIILVLALGSFFFYWKQNKSEVINPSQVACTMEAKICPDGKTYVGRQGPKCEFEKCPTSTLNETTNN